MSVRASLVEKDSDDELEKEEPQEEKDNEKAEKDDKEEDEAAEEEEASASSSSSSSQASDLGGVGSSPDCYCVECATERRMRVAGPGGRRVAYSHAFEHRWRSEATDYEQRYLGHCNMTTDIKEATFFGG